MAFCSANYEQKKKKTAKTINSINMRSNICRALQAAANGASWKAVAKWKCRLPQLLQQGQSSKLAFYGLTAGAGGAAAVKLNAPWLHFGLLWQMMSRRKNFAH